MHVNLPGINIAYVTSATNITTTHQALITIWLNHSNFTPVIKTRETRQVDVLKMGSGKNKFANLFICMPTFTLVQKEIAHGFGCMALPTTSSV